MVNKKIIAIVPLIVMQVAAFGFCQGDLADLKEKARQYYLKGNLYYQQGQYKEAQEEFRKALELLNRTEELLPEGKKELPEIQTPQETAASETLISPADTKTLQESRTAYLVGNDDVLFISVWQNQDLDQEVVVRPDGKISLPLIGDIQAAGLSIPQLDQVITEKFKEFIRNPEVSVTIRKIGGQKVFVLGEVRGPGVYSLIGGKTIMEAISLAGGLTRDAIASSVIIVRGGFASPKPMRISLNKALKGDARSNIVLQSEDIVFVPKKFIADLNYFLNQILQPLSQGNTGYDEVNRYKNR